jgi:ankyrin repeat protein
MDPNDQGTSLHEACFQGDLDRVAALLDAGADPDAPGG